MGRLVIRFPSFGEVFDGNKMRSLITQLENALSRITVSDSIGAYTLTTSATLGSEDEVVLVDTTSGDVTVTLPEISDSMVRNKQEFEVVKIVAANTLTIDATGTDTIVGEPDAVVTAQWTALRFRATTGNWVLI